MNQYYTGAGSQGSAEISYLSPRGHYYVTAGELDTRYARHAELINRYQPSMTGKNLSQFELAKRASRP